MSKAEAIKQLRDALRIADLPNCGDEGYRKDESTGQVIAANYAFKVGYMAASIREALAELGAQR